MADDTIYRKAAIEVIRKIGGVLVSMTTDGHETMLIDKAQAQTELMMLPSVQPYTDEEIQTIQDLEQAQIQKAYELGKAEAQERKTGKWIRIGGSEKCSVCGYTIDDEYYLGNFCQNCGAEMKGEGDGV